MKRRELLRDPARLRAAAHIGSSGIRNQKRGCAHFGYGLLDLLLLPIKPLLGQLKLARTRHCLKTAPLRSLFWSSSSCSSMARGLQERGLTGSPSLMSSVAMCRCEQMRVRWVQRGHRCCCWYFSQRILERSPIARLPVNAAPMKGHRAIRRWQRNLAHQMGRRAGC